MEIDEKFLMRRKLKVMREEIEEKIEVLNQIVKRLAELEAELEKGKSIWDSVFEVEESICYEFRDCYACPITCERSIKGVYCEIYECKYCPNLRYCPNFFG